ncbi:phosphotransferase family protein [Ectothiorhodospiraceae bacterium WFHF3C12]|nr:phosphotransferase family protein [Ectothiorhodospiraceae bacterium WFHF3C12]
MPGDETQLREALEALAGRLAAGGSIHNLCKLTGGASQQTWSLDLVSPAGTEALILRRAGYWTSGGSDQNIALADEARLQALLREAGVEVPGVRYVLTDADGLGEGYLMERIDGEGNPFRIVNHERYAGARAHLARQCGEALGRIHTLATGELGFLRATTPRDEIERQREAYRRQGPRRPVLELALRWLQDNCPPPGTPALVHGDFRTANLLVDPDGLRAVIDWEMAHLGDPMEDLGWICVNSWRFGHSHLPVGGFGTREALFAGYESVTGRPVDPQAVRFWEVYGSLKWGVICRMMAASYRDGSGGGLEPAVIGRRTSEAEVDLLHLLAPLSGRQDDA